MKNVIVLCCIVAASLAVGCDDNDDEERVGRSGVSDVALVGIAPQEIRPGAVPKPGMVVMPDPDSWPNPTPTAPDAGATPDAPAPSVDARAATPDAAAPGIMPDAAPVQHDAQRPAPDAPAAIVPDAAVAPDASVTADAAMAQPDAAPAAPDAMPTASFAFVGDHVEDGMSFGPNGCDGPHIAVAAATAGMLIRGDLPRVYYLHADGKRYVFPTMGEFVSWYGVADPATGLPVAPDDPSVCSQVMRVTDLQLAAIPLGGAVGFRPGTYVIRAAGNPPSGPFLGPRFAVGAGNSVNLIGDQALADAIFGAAPGRERLVSGSQMRNYWLGRRLTTATDFDAATERRTTLADDLAARARLTPRVTVTQLSALNAQVAPGASDVELMRFRIDANFPLDVNWLTVKWWSWGGGLGASEWAYYIWNVRLVDADSGSVVGGPMDVMTARPDYSMRFWQGQSAPLMSMAPGSRTLVLTASFSPSVPNGRRFQATLDTAFGGQQLKRTDGFYVYPEQVTVGPFASAYANFGN